MMGREANSSLIKGERTHQQSQALSRSITSSFSRRTRRLSTKGRETLEEARIKTRSVQHLRVNCPQAINHIADYTTPPKKLSHRQGKVFGDWMPDILLDTGAEVLPHPQGHLAR